MFLFAGDLVRRAHHFAVGLGLTASAHADTACCRLTERPAVVAECKEEVLRLGWRPVLAEPQVLIECGRPHDLAGVHPVGGIEKGFGALESLIDLVSAHGGKQHALRLTVTWIK